MTGSELRMKRIEARISRQDELAAELGWNTETITDIERGRLGVDVETAEKIKGAIARIVAKREATPCEKVEAAATARRAG